MPPRPGVPAGPGAGPTAVVETRSYLDEAGRVRTAAIKVPVDANFGRPVSTWMRCTRCTPRDRWVPNGIAGKGDPMCFVHNRVMARVPIPKAPLLPWSAIVSTLKPYLYLWTVEKDPDGRRRLEIAGASVAWLAAAAGLGVAVARYPGPPPPAWAVLGLVLAWIVARRVGTRLTNRAKAQGKLDDDPEVGLRHRTAIASVVRTVAYAVTLAGLWVTAADLVGVDPQTLAGRIVWTVLPAVWLPWAATYWRWVRRNRQRREAAPTVVPDQVDGVPLEPDEAWVRYVWKNRLAVERGQRLEDPPPPPASSREVAA
jgi:hypothetical protein